MATREKFEFDDEVEALLSITPPAGVPPPPLPPLPSSSGPKSKLTKTDDTDDNKSKSSVYDSNNNNTGPSMISRLASKMFRKKKENGEIKPSKSKRGQKPKLKRKSKSAPPDSPLLNPGSDLIPSLHLDESETLTSRPVGIVANAERRDTLEDLEDGENPIGFQLEDPILLKHKPNRQEVTSLSFFKIPNPAENNSSSNKPTRGRAVMPSVLESERIDLSALDNFKNGRNERAEVMPSILVENNKPKQSGNNKNSKSRSMPMMMPMPANKAKTGTSRKEVLPSLLMDKAETGTSRSEVLPSILVAETPQLKTPMISSKDKSNKNNNPFEEVLMSSTNKKSKKFTLEDDVSRRRRKKKKKRRTRMTEATNESPLEI